MLRNSEQLYLFVSVFTLLFNNSFSWSPMSLYCYQCVSTQPGCGTPFNWYWYWAEPCPEEDDKCVKILERKGGNPLGYLRWPREIGISGVSEHKSALAETVITRECLSSLRAVRTDIPADHYEGCRPAAKDQRLAHYVNNTIKELDIRRDHYDETTWCFCYFDNRCNGASSSIASFTLIAGITFYAIGLIV